jgi:hypothetical protein
MANKIYLIFILIVSQSKICYAQICNIPATFSISDSNYVPIQKIQLGQGQLYKVWGVSADAYLPTNKKNWAIAMAHSAHLFKIISGTNKITSNFYFATAAKESFCGCDSTIINNSALQYPFNYVAAASGDGCFQIENLTAYSELHNQYPQRFAAGLHSQIIGNAHFETAALSKAYYDILGIKFLEISRNWNPIGYFKNAIDTNAAIRLIAIAYNRGLWYASIDTVLNLQRSTSIAQPNISNYFNNNSFGYDYQNALTQYNLVLKNSANSLDANLLLTNTATTKPYNYFDYDYNENYTWTDINAYIDTIAIMYPLVNIPILKTNVQLVFNSINNGNPIGFKNEMGKVIDALIKALPADDPTANVATNYGCAIGNLPACDTVENLIVNAINSNSASISWKDATRAGYRYGYKKSTELNYTFENTGENFATISNLDSCTNYQFIVKTICNYNQSSAYTSTKNISTIGCVPNKNLELNPQQIALENNKNSVIISNPNQQNLTITIVNMQGQKMKEYSSNQQKIIIDQAQQLCNGLYMILIKNNTTQHNFSTKIFIQ